jgi:hypothetical protein
MASLASLSPSVMKRTLHLLFGLLAFSLLGMASKPPVTVRFFVEANEHDTDRFATPIQLRNPPRTAYIEKIPVIHEQHIRALYPFQAANGTWGCAFQLNESGRINLEVASTQHRGGSIVAFVQTKSGSHQVVDMVIDKPVSDGVITIPYGLSELEIEALAKEFPVVGQKKKRK